MKKLPRFEIGKYGPKVNPVGEYVRFDYGERHLIGEVLSIYRDEVCGVTRAKVKHFNGEPWPVDPPLYNLGWIRQDAARGSTTVGDRGYGNASLQRS